MWWVLGFLIFFIVILPATLWIVRIVESVKFRKENKDFMMDREEQQEFQQEINDMKLRYIEKERIRRTQNRYTYRNKR